MPVSSESAIGSCVTPRHLWYNHVFFTPSYFLSLSWKKDTAAVKDRTMLTLEPDFDLVSLFFISQKNDRQTVARLYHKQRHYEVAAVSHSRGGKPQHLISDFIR